MKQLRIRIKGRLLKELSTRLRGKSGFTYIEVLVVAVIIITAFGGVVQVLSGSVQASSRAEHLKSAVALAQSELERILAGLPVENEVNQSSEYPEFSYQSELSGPDMDGLYRAQVNVYWKEAGRERQESLTAYFIKPEPVISGSVSKEQHNAGRPE